MANSRWFNQYPGAACDVASHLYSHACYMNPWWTRAYSRGGEIEAYLFDFATKFNLLKYIKFNTKVSIIDWNESKQVVDLGKGFVKREKF